MAYGYCVKERRRVEIARAVEVTMKNGRPAIQGYCPYCGTKIFKIGPLPAAEREIKQRKGPGPCDPSRDPFSFPPLSTAPSFPELQALDLIRRLADMIAPPGASTPGRWRVVTEAREFLRKHDRT